MSRYTCERSRMNPHYYIIRKPNGQAWRVCHEDRIDQRMRELNTEDGE